MSEPIRQSGRVRKFLLLGGAILLTLGTCSTCLLRGLEREEERERGPENYLERADQMVRPYDAPEISTERTADLLQGSEPTLLLDIREPGEYAVSHIRGALLVPPEAFKDGIPEALRDVPTTRTIVTYCTVGVRSAEATNQLVEAGFENVNNMRGSLIQWYNEGRPVVREDEEVDTIHPYDTYWAGFVRKRTDREGEIQGIGRE